MSGYSDTVTLYQDVNDNWRWTRKASNGKIVGASSEGYFNRSDCKDNAERNMIKVNIE